MSTSTLPAFTMPVPCPGKATDDAQDLSGSEGASKLTPAQKVLNISGMEIVYRGKVWNHAEDPSSKSMVHLLERNESIVTWLQPRGGSVHDQIPAINVNGQYRILSLRMQKSIWRHIRLKKGFVNLENLSQGGYKLKIPTMLLNEKEKTRNRFSQEKKADVQPEEEEETKEVEKTDKAPSKKKKSSTKPSAATSAMPASSPSAPPPVLTTPHPSSSSSRQSLCRKVRGTVLDVIVPIGKRKRDSATEPLPTKTCFVFTEDDALRRVVKRMLRECPGMCAQEDREGFLVKIMEMMESEETGASRQG